MMILTWMAYACLIGLLLSGAARVAEHGLELYGRPTRWLWAGAMIASLALPVILYLVPVDRPVLEAPMIPLPEIPFESAADGRATSGVSGRSAAPLDLDAAVGALWALGSLALLAFLIVSHLRLERESQGWVEEIVDGRKVLLASAVGPAVAGLVRGRILLPRWAIEMKRELRALILLHEEEHLRAGDHKLLLGGLFSLVLAPWNAPLWWCFRRLRLAVELDCDRRVLASGVGLERYNDLLLQVARRASRIGILPLAFSRPRPLLELRLVRLARTPGRRRPAEAAGAGLIALVLVASAAAAPSPQRPAELARRDPGARAGRAPPPALQDTARKPTYVPYTEPPKLRNREEVFDILDRHYPQLLELAGVEGLVHLWLYVDRQGALANALVRESSGHPALDSAALQAVRELEFDPAFHGEDRVAVWVSMPIPFRAAVPEPARHRGLPLIDAFLGPMRGALRKIATAQENHFKEAGTYYRTLDAEPFRDMLSDDLEVILYQAHDSGWAAVLRNEHGECAMYYGRIAAPRSYAAHGRAICQAEQR